MGPIPRQAVRRDSIPHGRPLMPTGLGASWTRHCRWQVRLIDDEGEPVATWRWCDTLADCRQDFADSDAITARVKHDGDPYGVLSRAGDRTHLKRGPWPQ
jgi:hypothetical protein